MPINAVAAINGVPYIVGQIPGSGTNDSPSAGNLGEVLSASATGVSLTTTTAKTIISKALTPGRWEVTGIIAYIPAATTTVTDLISEVTAVDNTLAQTLGNYARLSYNAMTTGGRKIGAVVPPQRILVPSSGSVTYYLVGYAEFGTSTMTADGFIRALRV